MSLANRVLLELDQGKWTLQSIAPSFHRRLSNATGALLSGNTISEVCLSHYSKTPIGDVSIRSQSRELDLNCSSDQAKSIIEQIFKADYPDSALGSFAPDESQKLQRALANLENNAVGFPSHYRDIVSSFVRILGVNFRSASHPQLFGLIMLGDGIASLDERQLAVSIVHECAHQELFLINLLDRLVNQPFDFNEVHAPFQGVKRPPIGRLHSMWALYRMIQFQKQIGELTPKYTHLLKENVEAFEAGELTPFGKNLVDIARKRAC